MVDQHDTSYFWMVYCLEIDEGKIIKAYPARVKFRGFGEDYNTEGYQKVSEFMDENAKVLKEESYE